MRFAVVIEKAGENFSAYVPDLPGCVATGRTRRAVERLIREAIVLHLEGMREDGERLPRPTARAGYVDTAGSVGAMRRRSA